MAKTTIPAQTIVTCDFCGTKLHEGNWHDRAVIEMRVAARDLAQIEVGEKVSRFDACDRCNRQLTEAIEALRLR